MNDEPGPLSGQLVGKGPFTHPFLPSKEAETAEIPGHFQAKTSFGALQVVPRADLIPESVWESFFGHHSKGHRYHGLVERTIPQNFHYRYLLLEDHAGQIRSIQPCFLLAQDLTAGTARSVRAVIASIRKTFPGFLNMKMLMVGCSAGEGHLGLHPDSDARWVAKALHESLALYAAHSRVSLITLKDFPAVYRDKLNYFREHGYVRIPSFPSVKLSLKFASFDDFFQNSLSKATRKDLRRKFKKTAALPVHMEVVNDVTPYVDEIYPLYRQVFERTDFRFEELTKEYFCALGQEIPDRTRFFLWRQEGRIVAFSLCMVHDGVIYDNYLGLDYSVALDLHLYFVTIRDIMQWAIDQKLHSYCSTPLNYDPKVRLRFDLDPLDLYVAHTSSWISPFFRRILPWLEPTRNDPVLKLFPNHADLWT